MKYKLTFYFHVRMNKFSENKELVYDKNVDGWIAEEITKLNDRTYVIPYVKMVSELLDIYEAMDINDKIVNMIYNKNKHNIVSVELYETKREDVIE